MVTTMERHSSTMSCAITSSMPLSSVNSPLLLLFPGPHPHPPSRPLPTPSPAPPPIAPSISFCPLFALLLNSVHMASETPFQVASVFWRSQLFAYLLLQPEHMVPTRKHTKSGVYSFCVLQASIANASNSFRVSASVNTNGAGRRESQRSGPSSGFMSSELLRSKVIQWPP